MKRGRAQGPAASAYVSAKLGELEARVAETARDLVEGRGDDAVHDLRVALRRMRTLLGVSRGLYGRWHTTVVRRAFADVMRATGELRDEEVLYETLEAAGAPPELAAWLGRRRARLGRLRRAVTMRIERGELERARGLLAALLAFPVEPARDEDLARFARKTVERARRGVDRAKRAELEDVAGLHELRIAYKVLRYSTELLGDALPLEARAQLAVATTFQKRLGEIHDVDVAREVLRGARGLSIEARRAGLEALAALRRTREEKYLRERNPLAHSVQREGAESP